MDNEKRIEVNGYFGSKMVTEVEFVKTWVEEANGFFRLSWSLDWADKVNKMKEDVAEEAAREFNRIYGEKKAS